MSLKTRVNIINPSSGEPEFPIVMEGKTIDVARFSILAKHRDLYAGGHLDTVDHEQLAARVYIWGIPYDHDGLRANQPILVNRPLNLPDVVDKDKAIWTVIDVDNVQNYIGFVIEIETRPMQAPDVTNAVYGAESAKYGKGAKIGWTIDSQTAGHYYQSNQVMQANYFTGVLNANVIFRAARNITEGVNNTGSTPT
jgi:hypothetical protein